MIFTAGQRDPCKVNVAGLLENVKASARRRKADGKCLCTLSTSETTSQVDGDVICPGNYLVIVL